MKEGTRTHVRLGGSAREGWGVSARPRRGDRAASIPAGGGKIFNDLSIFKKKQRHRSSDVKPVPY